MATKVYLNNVLIPHKDGIPITFTNNEQLDSGVLVIPNVTTKLNIKRNDEIRIVADTTKYYLVAGYHYSLASKKSPYMYTYELTLISQTMLLQSYLLPNITITQPLNNKYTIYQEACRILYILNLQNIYTFSYSFVLATNSTICPEFSFNRRNFWEILNSLLEVVDCVVTMDSPSVIGCRRLNNPTIEEVDSSKIIDMEYFADANEFCSELEMNAENVVGDNVTTNSEYWVTPRSNAYILTTDNAQLLLEKPIYYLNKVIVTIKLDGNLQITDPSGETVYETYLKGTSFTFDITKWVVEDSVYNTKLPSSTVPYYSDTAFDLKKFFLSYKVGSEIIDNLSYNEKVLLSDMPPTIYNILLWEIWHYYWEQHPEHPNARFDKYTQPDNYFPDIREILFNIDYVSLNTIRFRTKKQTDEVINKKVLASNQTASYVDANALGKSEQANANRIGNEYYELTLQGFIPDSSKYYYYQENGVKYYLTKYQIRYTDIGSTYLTGIFTKNFIQKDLFTGINSKPRYTSIATGSDVLLRQDIVNIKFTVDNKQTSEIDFLKLFNTMWTYLGVRKKYEALVNTDATVDFFKLPIASYLLGNNHIILEFRFKNNASAGMYVDNSSSNMYICKDAKYVDDNGEFGYIYFCIQLVTENDTDQQLQARKYPIAYKNGNKINSFDATDTVIDIDARKDNREIYGVCVSIEFESNNEYIELTDYFFQNLPLVCNKTTKLYMYLGESIEVKQQVYLDQDINAFLSVEGQYINFFIEDFCHENSIDFNTLNEWGICDGNNNKLIKVTDRNINKLYFNKE